MRNSNNFLNIFFADTKDIDDIFKIECENFAIPLSKNLLLSMLNNDSYSIFLYKHNNEILGYYIASTVEDIINLDVISVKKEYREKNIASYLLLHLNFIAMENNISRIELEVRKSNKAAINLYKKYKFINDGYRKNYYDNPIEDAVLMSKNIKKDIIGLGIETSCDETSIAIVKNGKEILSNKISSQISTHTLYGGVVPEIASRLHLDIINSLLDEAINESQIAINDIDFISVTRGPGLVGALLVGISVAKTLSFVWDKPLIGVNHMQGHIASASINNDISFPFLALIVSGGHTYFCLVNSYSDYQVLGETRDDACGESFDKVARLLGLGYPGGPKVEELAKKGKANIDFPRALKGEDTYDVSFSGLKTSVMNYVNNSKQKNIPIVPEDICASFQRAIFDVLIDRTSKMFENTGIKTLVLSGGVAGNKTLRKELSNLCAIYGAKLYYPDSLLCTDNAAMIATVGTYKYLNGEIDSLDFKAEPSWGL